MGREGDRTAASPLWCSHPVRQQCMVRQCGGRAGMGTVVFLSAALVVLPTWSGTLARAGQNCICSHTPARYTGDLAIARSMDLLKASSACLCGQVRGVATVFPPHPVRNRYLSMGEGWLEAFSSVPGVSSTGHTFGLKRQMPRYTSTSIFST